MTTITADDIELIRTLSKEHVLTVDEVTAIVTAQGPNLFIVQSTIRNLVTQRFIEKGRSTDRPTQEADR